MKIEDRQFFEPHPERRLHIRPALPEERVPGGEGLPWWFVVVRSKHGYNWNTVAFPFARGAQPFDVPPKTDDEALQIVARLNFPVMRDVLLLLISATMLGDRFFNFDREI